MTAEEFIEDYSLRRAREIQADMLAASSRRPKEWRVEEPGEELYIYFDGCPFRLKSERMVLWLRALLLLIAANEGETRYGFSPVDQFAIGYASMAEQLSGNFWLIEPLRCPQVVYWWINNAMAEDDSIDYEECFAVLGEVLYSKIKNREVPTNLLWDCWSGWLLCMVYILEFYAKTGNFTDHTGDAISILRGGLDGCIEQVEEVGIEKAFGVDAEIFEYLIKMIPQIEEKGREDVTRWFYEIARDYYRATRRDVLAEKFSAKLAGQ